ncbi:hypothetical protein L7F22_048754 [Adiantum nelumboides]|nr:hypothetical protein [Adiantum nelumboides]
MSNPAELAACRPDALARRPHLSSWPRGPRCGAPVCRALELCMRAQVHGRQAVPAPRFSTRCALARGGAPVHDAIARHPYTARFHSTGQLFRHPWHAEKRDDSEAATRGTRWTSRSSAPAPTGPTAPCPKKSIQNAYIEMIREASHCIYIENQFFITATEPGTPVVNLIGAALVERILSAAKDGRKF